MDPGVKLWWSGEPSFANLSVGGGVRLHWSPRLDHHQENWYNVGKSDKYSSSHGIAKVSSSCDTSGTLLAAAAAASVANPQVGIGATTYFHSYSFVPAAGTGPAGPVQALAVNQQQHHHHHNPAAVHQLQAQPQHHPAAALAFEQLTLAAATHHQQQQQHHHHHHQHQACNCACSCATSIVAATNATPAVQHQQQHQLAHQLVYHHQHHQHQQQHHRVSSTTAAATVLLQPVDRIKDTMVSLFFI